MKKRILALVLTLFLALSLAACSSSGSSEQPSQPQETPQTQEPVTAESNNTETENSEPSEDVSDNMTDDAEQEFLAGLTDEERAQYEEYKEFKKQKEENNASKEVNEYGITDEALQSLVEAIKENVTNDYLNVYNISTSDFSWPEAGTEFWGKTGAVINVAGSVGGFTSYPESVLEDLPDEDAALAKALMSSIAEWEDKDDGDFMPIYFALSDENGLNIEKTAQFFADNITFE